MPWIVYGSLFALSVSVSLAAHHLLRLFQLARFAPRMHGGGTRGCLFLLLCLLFLLLLFLSLRAAAFW